MGGAARSRSGDRRDCSSQSVTVRLSLISESFDQRLISGSLSIIVIIISIIFIVIIIVIKRLVSRVSWQLSAAILFKSAVGGQVFLELCPEFRGDGPKARNSLADTMCPHWLEVAEETLSRSAQWEAWLRVQALNSLAPENFSLAYDSFFRGMPYQMDDAAGDGTHAPDGFVPLPATSSCSGAEDDLRQCFWAQLTDRLQKRPSVSPQPQSRPCRWKIVVGCTDEHSDTAQTAAKEDGVFLLGDLLDPYDIGPGVIGNFDRPKIFTHFDGPYNCSTGVCLRARVCVCECV